MSKRHSAALLLLAASIASVVYGRVQTIHMTEGEALIAAWGCWFTAICTAMLSCYLWKKGGTDAMDE